MHFYTQSIRCVYRINKCVKIYIVIVTISDLTLEYACVCVVALKKKDNLFEFSLTSVSHIVCVLLLAFLRMKTLFVIYSVYTYVEFMA